MSDELTQPGPEDSVHDCLSSTWSAGSGGWYCSHCGQWQCTITGRVAIQRPDLYQPDRERDLKSLARAYVKKHGTEDWSDLGYVQAEDFIKPFIEADQSFLAQWYREYFSDDE